MDFKSPSALVLNENIAENWRIWRQQFENFLTATEAKNKSHAVKIAMLLTCIGPASLERYNNFTYLQHEDKTKFDVIIAKFEEHFRGQKRCVFSRYQFWSHRRQTDRFEEYLVQLQTLAQPCEFAEREAMIRDKIIFSLTTPALKERLLRENDLSLSRTTELCRAHEIAQGELQTMTSTNDSSQVLTVRPKKPFKSYSQNSQNSQNQSQNMSQNKNFLRQPCRACGSKHLAKRDACPAWGKECRECGKKNHFAKQCRSKKRPKQVYDLETTSDPDQPFTIDSLDSLISKNELHVTLSINGKNLEMKIDTGAKCNVISLDTYNSLRDQNKIDKSNPSKLIAFGGSSLETLGTTYLSCETSQGKRLIQFHVLNQAVQPILGLRDVLELNLINLGQDVHSICAPEDILTRHAELFTGKLGKLPVVYKMKIDPNVQPVIQPSRNLPVATKQKVKQKLEEMCQQNVICTVSEPTEWVSAMVVALKKNGSIRICIDPYHLNKALLRPRHPLRTIEQVTSDIPGAKIFSTIDVTNGFWSIPLDHDSSLLTTFATPFGRFRFLRMPFGITTGSEVFQQAMESVFADQPCEIIVDDILIWGSTVEEHDRKLEAVLRRAKEVNLQLNPNKCRFRVKEVCYIGHVLTSAGLKPDMSKIQAISEMPVPEDKQALQRFLGTVNYLAKFIPNQSDLTSPLRELLHKEINWTWMPHHQCAFEKLKTVLSSPPVLRFFDVKQPVLLTCDASQSGLGAAIMQNSQPVAYASRALTETEQRYAQIEKELLAVVFACSKFNDYIHGLHIKIETDHQPLVSIVKKPLNSAPTRLQKMLMRLHKYNFTLVYKKGKDLVLADTLSRAYLKDQVATTDDYTDYEIITLYPLSSTATKKLREHTCQDSVLQTLSSTIQTGWPSKPTSLPESIRRYFSNRDQLLTHDDIIMCGERVVVPSSLRNDYLKQVHAGHPGLESTKRRARTTIFWPGIMHDIEQLLNECHVCAEMKPHLQKETLLSHSTPTLPWEDLSADIFEWNNHHYLVVVDA